MKLLRARVRNYRSVRDSGWFDVEANKSILVGTNESGKTALLRALQSLNAPEGEATLDPFRDYPRSNYGRISRGELKAELVPVVEGVFSVDDDLRAAVTRIDSRFSGVDEVTVTRFLGNNVRVSLDGVPASIKWRLLAKRFASIRSKVAALDDSAESLRAFDAATEGLTSDDFLTGDQAVKLAEWLVSVRPRLRDADRQTAEDLLLAARLPTKHASARAAVLKHMPVFVYYSSFTTLRPRINLTSLADRIKSGDLDLDIDAGNVALFKLVGLDAAELSKQGRVSVKAATSQEDVEHVQVQLAKRQHAFSEAAKDLTATVRRVWGERKHKLEFRADGDYVRVVVIEDEVEIDLDQRSAGFVWLVSFYVVFKAEASDNLANAILLLDEPGLSLHALKQQQFRRTVSLIAEDNQTIYTTHSPFMVGPEELDLVRVVEVRPRRGTTVHNRVTSTDPASLFPLQAALGYSLAQSLFAQQRNLVCEGLTDYWYLEAMSNLLAERKRATLDDDIAVIPAGGASKVVFFAILLHSQRLKVAAILDSDQAGQAAATESDFVRLLGQKRIHRIGDYIPGSSSATTEDLLRGTLVEVAKTELGWDVVKLADQQPGRPIVEILHDRVKTFSKYKLAKAFLSWSSAHSASDLKPGELDTWDGLFKALNRSI